MEYVNGSQIEHGIKFFIRNSGKMYQEFKMTFNSMIDSDNFTDSVSDK